MALPLKPKTRALKQVNFVTFILNEKPQDPYMSSISADYIGNDPNASPIYITLPINPQEYIENWPSRNNITQTFGGAWIDYYGLGIGSITLRGTTGYRLRKYRTINRSGGFEMAETDGYSATKDFRDKIFRGLLGDYDPRDKKSIRQNYETYVHGAEWQLYFFNWANEDYYEVFPISFTLSQSANEPVLYRYNVQLIVVRRIDKDTYAPVGGDWVTNELTNAQARLDLIMPKMLESYWRNFIAINIVAARAGVFSNALGGGDFDWQLFMRNLMLDDDATRTLNGEETYEPTKYYYLLNDEELCGIAADPTSSELTAIAASSESPPIQEESPVYQEIILTADAQVQFKGPNLYQKLQKVNKEVGSWYEEIKQTREQGESFIKKPLSKLQKNMGEIDNIIKGVVALPREVFPYQLISELRGTYCLFMSLASFPELFKDSAISAYDDFLALVKDSGCATTIGRR